MYYTVIVEMENIEMEELIEATECPRCHSKDIRSKGVSKGRRKYYCKNCGRYFIAGYTPTYTEEVTLKCRKCGGSLNRSGKTPLGKQRYKCKCCGYKQVENPEDHVYVRSVTGMTCTQCGSINILKRGHEKDGRQRYICKDCGHSIMDRAKYKHMTKKQKKFIIMYGINLNIPVKEIAKEMNCCEKTVRNIKRKYLENLKKESKEAKVTIKRNSNKEIRLSIEQKKYIVEVMLRKEKRKQKEIAREIGCSHVTISRIKAWYKKEFEPWK